MPTNTETSTASPNQNPPEIHNVSPNADTDETVIIEKAPTDSQTNITKRNKVIIIPIFILTVAIAIITAIIIYNVDTAEEPYVYTPDTVEEAVVDEEWAVEATDLDVDTIADDTCVVVW